MNSRQQLHELLHPFSTTEHIDFLGENYTVWHPGLLEQIENTTVRSTMAGQVFRSDYGSKPAGRIDSIAFLARIKMQSLQLTKALNLPHREHTTRARLGVLYNFIDESQPNAMVENWWTAARILTQHDTPAMSLNVPCPREECDALGTLRVRLNPNIAFCVNCGATWKDNPADPQAEFGRFAVWVQWSAEHLKGAQHLTGEALEPCKECLVERASRAARVATRRNRGAH